MCTLNPEGIIQDLNSAFEDVLGWPADKMCFKSFREFIHPDDLDHSVALLQTTRTTGQPLTCRSRYQCLNGVYQAMSWKGTFDRAAQLFFIVGRPVATSYSTQTESHEVARRLEGMFDALLEGVIVFDQTNKVTRANFAALKIFECHAEPLPDEMRNEWVTLYPDMQICLVEDRPSARALRTGRPQLNEILALQKNSGPIKWVKVTAIPIFRDHEPAPYEVLLTITDITREYLDRAELLSVKNQLASRERFLNAMLGAIPSLVSYVDRDYRYRYVNRGYEVWFGQPASQITGKKIHDVVGKESIRHILPYMDRAMNGETVQYELEMDYDIAGHRSVQCTYVPDINSDGLVIGLYAVVHDVLTQINAQRSLGRKEEEIKRLLDMIPAAVGYWTPELRNVYANDGFQKYFYGLGKIEMRGLKIDEILSTELYADIHERVRAVLRGEPQEFERDLPRPDGGIRHMHTCYLPDFVDGKVAGFLGFTTDVTKLKKLEADRHQMELRLMASSKLLALGEMAGGIAHQINNPLAIILGKTAMLRMDFENAQVSTAEAIRELANVEGTVERIAKIIRGLRSFARDSETEPKFPTNVSLILSETLDVCRERLGAEHIQLTVHDDTTMRVNCRLAQISQILLNVLLNSIDALKDSTEKWIELRVERAQSMARITVTDGGHGIAAEIKDRIMLPFFTTKVHGEGAGLGLSVAARLAADHGGSLQYDHQSKQTKFILELPLDPTSN